MSNFHFIHSPMQDHNNKSTEDQGTKSENDHSIEYSESVFDEFE